MKPRQGIVESFSTFLQLDADHDRGWLVDPKLRRSMQRQVEQASQPESERYWTLYWHQVWQTQASPLASDHLAAYLQEACYWTARKIALNFAAQQLIADLFQSAIAGLPKVLKSFNRDLSSNFKGFAELIFGNLIKDSLRKNQEIDICTDWSLLNRLSQKTLVEALQFVGVKDTTIAFHVLAWTCYRELAAPGTKSIRKQAKPDPAIWSAIANLYNTHRDVASPIATPESMEKSMLACVAAVRAFRKPTVVSANTPQYGQETGELLDSVASLQDPLLNTLIEQEEAIERQTQKGQLQEVLNSAIVQLDPQLQTLLKTYYGSDLTQQQIAQQLGMKQYAISRSLTRARTALLRAIAQWSQDTLHLSLTPQVLDSMNTVLEQWLHEKIKGEVRP